MTHSSVQYTGRDLEEAMSVAPPKYHAWILSHFERYLGDMVAEVGAGSGNFSSQLLQKIGGTLIAVEPSTQMYPLLKRRFANDPRVVCEQHFFRDVASRYNDSLDSIVYVNVLEHVKDDLQELVLARESIKPGGHICVFVPALPFLFSEFDASVGHYRRYKKYQLAMLMRDAGFEIVELLYFDIVGILPWLVFMKRLRQPRTSGSAGLYDTLVVPPMRKIESLFRPPIGKNLIVVGRRPLV
ncbi:MAG: methyltransferase domain-containing protein [bacterium]|nr:methyltransferase domain-containing protein [bacterium]